MEKINQEKREEWVLIEVIIGNMIINIYPMVVVHGFSEALC